MIATVDYHHLYYKDYWLSSFRGKPERIYAGNISSTNVLYLYGFFTGRNHDYDQHHHLFLLFSEKYAQ